MRGAVLGTTATFVDIGLADRRDIRFSMPFVPVVDIAEPSSAAALAEGTEVCVASAGAVARGVLVEPPGLRILAQGRRHWDRPGASTLEAGRIVRLVPRGASLMVALAIGHSTLDLAIPPGTPIAKLRPGSRAALVAGHSALIIARVQPDDIIDAAERIIVGDGTLTVPI